MTPFINDLTRLADLSRIYLDGRPVAWTDLRDAVAAVHGHLSGGEKPEPAPCVLAEDPRLQETVQTVYGPARWWRKDGGILRLYVDGRRDADFVASAYPGGVWYCYRGGGSTILYRNGTSDDPIGSALIALRELGTIDTTLPPATGGEVTVNDTPADRLDQFISEGRLVRHVWTDIDEEGREVVCLLAAMAPECGAAESAAACPADIMPKWLAHLTPWMDDAGSVEAWPSMVRRYAAVAHRWHVLTDEDWRQLDYRVRGIMLKESLRHVADVKRDVRIACERTIALLQRVADGQLVDRGEWDIARDVDRDAAYAARAVARLVRDAARDSPEAARDSAEAVRDAARDPAEAADRITNAVLAAIEDACAAREAPLV